MLLTKMHTEVLYQKSENLQYSLLRAVTLLISLKDMSIVMLTRLFPSTERVKDVTLHKGFKREGKQKKMLSIAAEKQFPQITSL